MISLPQGSGTIVEEELDKNQRSGCGEAEQKSIVWTRQDLCTHTLTMAVVIGMRPMQYQYGQHSIVVGKIVPEHPLLTEELLTVGGFQGRESQFSLRVWFLMVDHIPAAGPTPIWATQFGVKIKEGTELGC